MIGNHSLITIGAVTVDLTAYNGADLYNEGDDVEDKILAVLKAGIDPIEVITSDNRWPILYQMSPVRKHILEPMDIKPDDNVLEIGSGMGALSGGLAEICNQLDCIELSKRRSLANAYRNQKYNNIKIFVGNFQDIMLHKKYDVIVLVGVLEYAGCYIQGENPCQKFLEIINSYLKPGGKVYIAIENRLGLKYFAGCSEDHLGKPFSGIEGYNETFKVRTFSRYELKSLLLSTGFKNIYFYYPYPDYKLPSVIYSDDYSPNETFFIQTNINYDMSRLNILNEDKVYRSFSEPEDWKNFSNSFLVEMVKG